MIEWGSNGVAHRFVGIKSRGIYETPGGEMLRTAHVGLEGLTLDREVYRLRDMMAAKFAGALLLATIELEMRRALMPPMAYCTVVRLRLQWLLVQPRDGVRAPRHYQEPGGTRACPGLTEALLSR